MTIRADIDGPVLLELIRLGVSTWQEQEAQLAHVRKFSIEMSLQLAALIAMQSKEGRPVRLATLVFEEAADG